MNFGWIKLRWSKWEEAMCCELLLCDEMTIIEFIQIPFLQKSVLNYLKYKLDNINKFNMEKKSHFCTPSTDVCVSWTFIYVLAVRFLNISLRPSSFLLHSWPALLLLQTSNPAVSQQSSRNCIYGLLTSRECFQSLGVSFHFRVSAHVNMVMYTLAICWEGPTASMTSA